MNATTQAREFLETQETGLFQQLITITLQNDGIIYSSDRALLLGIPSTEHTQTLMILFAFGNWQELMQLAKLLSHRFTHALWNREFKASPTWRRYSFKSILKHQHT